MIINKNLSIVIPTFNRADFLDYSLKSHIPLLKKYNIQIFISDNASTDNTEVIVNKWMKEYSLLRYSKNTSNIGADGNFEKALKMPNTEYMWLLSDTYGIPNNGITHILDIIDTKKEYDVIVCNLENKLHLKTKDYNENNNVLNDLGALMTCAAINIYNKDLIEKANFDRYRHTNFIQTGIIFEYIASKSFNIRWVSDISITGLDNGIKKTNWSHTPKAFEIGCKDWTNFVLSLPPSYSFDSKIKCIMDFGKVSGLFTFKNLLFLRGKELLNIIVFNKYKKLFPFTIDYPLWLIFIISILPIKLLNKFIKLYQGKRRK